MDQLNYMRTCTLWQPIRIASMRRLQYTPQVKKKSKKNCYKFTSHFGYFIYFFFLEAGWGGGGGGGGEGAGMVFINAKIKIRQKLFSLNREVSIPQII